MSDTKIPVKKLVDSSGYYYPLSTLESVISSEGITVKNTIGSYRPNDVINPKTTLKSILSRILVETGEDDAVLHLSNVDVDKLSDKATRIPCSPLVAELLQKLKEDIEKKLIKAAHYRGSVDYYKDLPTDTAEVGDIYNVRYRGTSGTEEDGNNYIFDDTNRTWDKLSGFADLGDFYTKFETDTKLANLKIYIDEQDNSIKNEYVKKIDATGNVIAEEGKCITGIAQVDGKITSVTSAKLGTDVSVIPAVSTGTKLADIRVDNSTTPIYSPYTSGVIETWRNEYDWYRLYSDGWIEQGGIITCESPSKSLIIPFHKIMKDSYCSVQVTQDDNTANDDIVPFKKIHNQDRIIVSWNNFSTPTFDWKCVGYVSEAPMIYYTVTFDANGGTVSETTRRVIKDTAVGRLPVPDYEGYDFVGWFTSKIGGIMINSSTIIGDNVVFYAHWISKTCIITFDSNGGIPPQTTKVINKGSQIGELPFATKSGFILKGWFTSKTGGNQIDSSTIAIIDTTYYAQWEEEITDDLLCIEEDYNELVITEDGIYNINVSEIITEPILATEGDHNPVITEDKKYNISLKNSTEPILATEIIHDPVVTEDKQNGISLKDSSEPLLSSEISKQNINTEDYNNKLKV